MSVSEQRKSIARFFASFFGGRPPITSYTTSDRSLEVGVVAAADAPDVGQVSYATIGLSEHPLILKKKEFATRIELVAFSTGRADALAAALSTACFTIIRETHFASPGMVMRDVLDGGDSVRMKHFLFSNPFPWEPPLESQTFGDVRVAWLLAVPLTDAEAEFAESKGGRALEEAFDAQQIDIADLGRSDAQLPVAGRTPSGARSRGSKRASAQAVADGWSLELPAGFRRRIEDDAVVFWRRGLTIWAVAASSRDSAPVRIERYLAEATPDRTSERPMRRGALSGVSYRAPADGSDAKAPSLNALIAAPGSSLIISFYFDEEKDIQCCLQILDGAVYVSPQAN